MFAVYGSRSDVIDLGPHMPGPCAACGAQPPLHLVLYYRFYHLFFELGAVVEKHFALQCTSCRAAQPTAAPPGFSVTGRIPFLRRFGLYAWLAFVFAVAIPLIVQEYARLLK